MTEIEKHLIVKSSREHVSNAYFGEPEDKITRKDNGLCRYPDLKYVKIEIEQAYKLLQQLSEEDLK